MTRYSKRYKYQKSKSKFNRGLYFGVRLDDVDKALKIKIRF